MALILRSGDVLQNNENADGGYCYITNVSPETLLYILSHLDAKSAITTGRTCKHLRDAITYCDLLWKRLCWGDFELHLHFRKPFATYYDIYRLVTMSRSILRVYLSERFYSSGRYGILPGWLWTWVVLCTCAPQLPRWILAHREAFLRLKISELPLGRIYRTWNVSAEDMASCRAVRNERGTAYYTWFDVHRVALRKHGGFRGFLQHSLKRCARAKKHIEKHFNELKRSRELHQTSGEQTIVALTTGSLFGTCSFPNFFGSWQEGRSSAP